MEQGIRLNNTYLVLEQLGLGGGGVVYKAYHERLQTYVVIKQVREKVKGILEGRAEADILKKLKHSNLPQVYDFLEIDDEIYTVMDYIPGESLDKVIQKQRRFGSQKVYQWALQLADALSYLHSQKPAIIHSDIKPANVMLTPEGNVSLIDFNISLAFDDKWQTSVGISGGYSPPEQHPDFKRYLKRINTQKMLGQGMDFDETVVNLSETDRDDITQTVLGETKPDEMVLEEQTVLDGKDRKTGTRAAKTESLIASIAGRGVDERSDIYSLGATLYHLLTGVKPAENFEKIRSLRSFDIKIGQGFTAIIEKMMELDPERRYQNGQELLYALEHVYELDRDFVTYKRKCRMEKILAAIFYAGSLLLIGLGWRTMEWECFTAYSQSMEQADVFIDDFDFEQAKAVIEEAMHLLPERIEAYEKEVLRLYAKGSYDEAISYARDIINNPIYEVSNSEEEKLVANIFYILGNSYFEKKDYTNAMNCLKEALDRNKENSLYFRDYSISLAKTGNIPMAKEVLDTAIQLGLGEDSLYLVQGEIACAKGEDSLAVEYLQDSIRSAQSEELLKRSTLLCAQVYERLGEDYLEEEIALLEKSEYSFGTGMSMHISEQLADAYARKAGIQEESSAEYYKKALDKFMELNGKGYATRQTMENMAILYQQTERFEDAEAVLLQITEGYPEDYRAYKRLAFLEADIQQKKENTERDYKSMREKYKMAEELYEKQGIGGDTEMEMLKNMLRDLEEGGWFQED